MTFFLLKGRRNVAISNVKRAFPDLPGSEASDIAKRCFGNLGINFVEAMVLPFIPKEELGRRFTMVNKHYFDEAASLNKGIMALVFHYANWEIMGVASHFFENDIVVLARPLKRHRILNEFLINLRVQTGLTVIPNANTGKDVIRCLKENKIVAILGDQREKRSKAIYVEFFGERVPTSRGITMIAMKTRAPVIPFYYRREGFLRYTIVCCPPIEMERKGNIEELIYSNTRKINACLESIIRENPAEWFWVHRRWGSKRQAKGKR
jgi:KDO2-lipid IV(A) lauroyltransferase